jgi:hypothetical protein
VHSILRRLDDDYCDPLELRGDSALGVPGLIGAVRAGRVMLSNALGTGVLESAAWLGFMPPIAERLIGETLLLPEIATWWLGEKPALEYVLANLDRLVIKPTYPNQRFEPMFGREFEGKARDLLIERLRNRPYAYVAQEHVRLSQAPVWKSAASSELATRALTIRVYAVVTPDGVRVMPGGLARVANEAAADVVSTQRGGGAKDIWVLSDDPHDETITSAQSGKWANLQRQDYIPSRLVENLYWLGRYTVRCENASRLLLRTLAARAEARVWTHARQICRDLGAVSAEGEVFDALRTRESQGLQADVKHLAWCASQVRNRLSARYWRGVVGLQRQMQEAMATRGSSREVYERVLLSLAALTGFSEEDMMHDEGWRVMRLGRRLERMQFVANILVRQLQGGLRSQRLVFSVWSWGLRASGDFVDLWGGVFVRVFLLFEASVDLGRRVVCLRAGFFRFVFRIPGRACAEFERAGCRRHGGAADEPGLPEFWGSRRHDHLWDGLFDQLALPDQFPAWKLVAGTDHPMARAAPGGGPAILVYGRKGAGQESKGVGGGIPEASEGGQTLGGGSGHGRTAVS